MNVPPTEAIRIPVDHLRSLSTTLFQKAGIPPQDADLITDLLIDTDLRGVLSHGTRQINGYIRLFMDGRMNPTPQIKVILDEPTTAIVDGDGGLGHLAATLATDLAIQKAKATGIGAAISRNHGHYGSAGKYTRMAIRQDCIGFSVSGHTTELSGRSEASRFQWNPLGCPPVSFAFPSGIEAPVILDMGTSFFDQDHFSAFFDQVPAVFFKSIGMVMTSHLLGGVLAGMMFTKFRPENRQYSAAAFGGFICVVDIGRFVPVEEFKAEVDRTIRQIHTLPPFPGYERYDLPGGPEWERERTWAVEGIPLGQEHQRLLEEIADELNVHVPWR
jgi:LDH2 family malate/lactate/ureidoglycolate dehydrogenase